MEFDSASTGPRLLKLPFAGVTSAPLFHAAWVFALGVGLTRTIWIRPGLMLVALLLVSGLCAMAALRAPRLSWLPMATMWLLMGAWCAEMEPQPAASPALAALSDGLLRTVEGTVVEAGPVRDESEEPGDDSAMAGAKPQISQRVDLLVSTVEVVNDESDLQSPIDGGVRMTIRLPNREVAPLACGDRIRADVRLLPPEEYHDPGAWSRADYLVGQGITASASVEAKRVERLAESRSSDAGGWRGWMDSRVSFHCRMASAQKTISTRLLSLPERTRGLPSVLRISGDDAVMLSAMVTGDRTYLSHSLRVGFERTGSFHMLVVSGLHLGIVAACIFWVTKRLRMPRVPATLLTMTASFGYALFTGFATPVQRALWMVMLYLLGRLIYRDRAPLNTIGFVALVLLAASPRSLFESGFQMTLLAVVAIGGVVAPLMEATIDPYVMALRDLDQREIDIKLPPWQAQFRVVVRMIADKLRAASNRTIGWRVFPWTLRTGLRLVELVTVSIVVEMAMTLPMALYFHRITIFALPVNLLVVPLLLVLVPAALITLGVLLVWPAAAAIPAAFVALLLHFSLKLVHIFGSIAFGDYRLATPLAWQMAGYVMLLAIAMILARAGKWGRRLTWVALAAAALLAVAPRNIQHPRDALLMETVDVGQGDSLLLITPDGKTLLVDGGGVGGAPFLQRQSRKNDFDIGEEVVSSALWARGIRHLDVVALSHAHSDHMGGLPAILRNFHPGELWVGNNPPIAAYNDLLKEATELGVRVKALRAGDSAELGAAHVNVLAPMADYKPGPEPANNDSLVLRVAYGASSVLLEGDAEAPIERAMLNEPGLASTLLKVGHHGSRSSSTPEFVSRVHPQWAVISCGLHNRYGHPRLEVLEEMESSNIRTFSTDVNGATCFRLDGNSASQIPCD